MSIRILDYILDYTLNYIFFSLSKLTVNNTVKNDESSCLCTNPPSQTRHRLTKSKLEVMPKTKKNILRFSYRVILLLTILSVEDNMPAFTSSRFKSIESYYCSTVYWKYECPLSWCLNMITNFNGGFLLLNSTNPNKRYLQDNVKSKCIT